jgi:hypothetical protein
MGNEIYNRDKQGRFSSFKIKLARFTKRVMFVMGTISVIGWSIVIGSHLMPITVYAEKEVVKEVKGHAPVMDRIAKCESQNSHINPKNGQVYMLANTNKTVDVGKYMINTVWHKKAKELGLDITKEVDNEKMAYYIYENHGTDAWNASSNCWK